MKKFIAFVSTILFISFIFSSCNKKEKLLKTTCKGKVYDVERNKPVPGYKIEVNRIWKTSSGLFSSTTHFELAGSAITDANGNYALEFGAIPGGEYFYETTYGRPYYSESIGVFSGIKPGAVNTYDINAWYPVILKTTLHVTNNNYPALTINSYSNNNGLSNEHIFEQAIVKTLFLKAKPNSKTRIFFGYSTGPGNSDFHSKYDSVTTTLQDTVVVSYNVDCNTF